MILKIIMFLNLFSCEKIDINWSKQKVTVRLSKEETEKINYILQDEECRKNFLFIINEAMESMKIYNKTKKSKIVFRY